MLGDRRLWVIALISFTFVGAIASSRHFALKAPVFDDPDAALRDIAVQHLGEATALEQLRAGLKSLPEGSPIYFVGSSRSWGGTEIYLLTSCLYWPHKVWFVNTAESLTAPPPPAPPQRAASTDSLFFYETEAPPTKNIVRIGPKLSVIPSRSPRER